VDFCGLYGTAPLDDSNQNRDHGEYQQDVNKSAEGVGTDHSQQPQNQEQDRNRPEHFYLLRRSREFLNLRRDELLQSMQN
jgi:hypothetical protein